jgi:hypothetical protein
LPVTLNSVFTEVTAVRKQNPCKYVPQIRDYNRIIRKNCNITLIYHSIMKHIKELFKVSTCNMNAN